MPPSLPAKVIFMCMVCAKSALTLRVGGAFLCAKYKTTYDTWIYIVFVNKRKGAVVCYNCDSNEKINTFIIKKYKAKSSSCKTNLIHNSYRIAIGL